MICRFKRVTMMLFVILFVLFANPLNVAALEFGGIPIIGKIDLPLDLNFNVNSTCSEHAYFMQATAREDGCFAIYSRNLNPDKSLVNSFDKVYIDIYNADGSFAQEVSFTTSLDLSIEITEETINIFFYSSILVYYLETQELLHYAIPMGAAVNDGVYKKLRREEFTCGNWKYICEKTFDGYTKLIRKNHNEVHILVEMPGTGKNFWNVLFPGIAAAIVGISVIIWIHKRGKTGDGFA